MINGTGSLSLRKKELENQKIPATGFVKTTFAHKASAGATGISLSSLTLPSEMSTNGFTNPPTSQLSNAQLLFFKNNLTLVSSIRGPLLQGLSYSVASSTQINFIGFTALEGEIFVGTIDYTAQTGIKVVDARPINATGTLAAGTTDFNVGIPFKVSQYSTTQVGGVLVFLDGVIQFRNTANSSSVLDGNYYEVDAGGGLGTIIRFNTTDGSDRNVLVVSNGLLSERPDGSMMATIESTQGQLNNMATYVATLAGQSTSTILGASPSNVDLKAFGDRVFTLEQNRARIDTGNTWTAPQSLIGATDGSPIATGNIGEVIVTPITGNIVSTTANTFVDGQTFTLQAGRWRVEVQTSLDISWVSGTPNPIGAIHIRQGSTVIAQKVVAIENMSSTTANRAIYPVTLTTYINISSPTTYKISVSSSVASTLATVAVNLDGTNYSGGVVVGDSKIFQHRIG